jgi:putative hydrolase of the HAD superfamily
MRNISAVTFDLWDTLIQEHPGGAQRVAKSRIDDVIQILGQNGIAHTEKEVQEAYDKSGIFLELTWSKRRDLTVKDQVLFLLNCIDGKLVGKLRDEDLEAIEKTYSEGILDNLPMLLPGAKEALKSVNSKGYRVGLISNTGRTPGSVLRVVMQDMGILHHFDVTSFSNELMVRKPAETIFRRTLADLKVPPKAAVHIGDNPDQDIEGAKKIGMHAIQFVTDGRRPSKAADDHVSSLERILEHIERL